MGDGYSKYAIAAPISAIDAPLETRVIDDNRSRAPHSAQGWTSRPLIREDIHHNLDH
jgi:hypothetical protein